MPVRTEKQTRGDLLNALVECWRQLPPDFVKAMAAAWKDKGIKLEGGK